MSVMVVIFAFIWVATAGISWLDYLINYAYRVGLIDFILGPPFFLAMAPVILFRLLVRSWRALNEWCMANPFSE